MSLLQFNAAEVEPQQSFEPLPAGVYIAEITDSEIVATKAGTGQMLKLTWKVLDGQYSGRLIFDRLNIANANPKAEETGQRQLSALCHSVGVLQLKDTAQLHALPCSVRVAVRKDETGQYGDQNEVKGYSTLPGQPAAPKAPPAPPKSNAYKPWAGKAA